LNEDDLRRVFAEAFIAQARSDWQTFELLAALAIPACHRLHFLQMTCEKVAKAYRLRDTKGDVKTLVSSHTGFEKFVGAFALTLKDEYEGRDDQLRRSTQSWRRYAREVEKLAPAIDRAASPENAEYPWQVGDRVVVPCTYSFPNLEFLRTPGGIAFLKLVKRALDDFERTTIH
jgi:hypothetical protein